MAVRFSPSGPQSVASPFSSSRSSGRSSSSSGRSSGGGGSSSRISDNLVSTRGGIRDERTGKIIAPLGTSKSDAQRLASKSYASYIQAQQREQKIQQQLKVQQQKVQAEQLSAKKEKVFSGTIAGQLSSGKPSSIGTVPEGNMGFVKGNVPSALFQSGRRLVKRVAGGVDRPSFSDIIAPIDRTVTTKQSSEAVLTSRGKGYIGVENIPKVYKKLLEKKGVETTTFGDIQRGIEKKREGEILSARDVLQEKVNTGELGLEQAQKDFSLKQEKIFKASKDVKGISSPRKAFLGTVIESAVYVNPLTSFSAAAYSSKSDPMKIDIKSLESGTSIGGAITQRPSLRTTGYLAAGVVGAGGLVSAGGRAVELAQIESSLRAAQLSQKGRRFVSGDLAIDVTSGFGKSSGTASSISKVTKSQVVGDEVISSGTERYITYGKKFWSGKNYIVGGERSFSAKISGAFEIEGTSSSFGAGRVGTTQKNIFSAVEGKKGANIKLTKFAEGRFEMNPIAGISSKKGNVITSFSGKVESADLEYINLAAKRGKGYQGINVKFPLESKSKLFVTKIEKDNFGLGTESISKTFKGGSSSGGGSGFSMESGSLQKSISLEQSPAVNLPKIKSSSLSGKQSLKEDFGSAGVSLFPSRTKGASKDGLSSNLVLQESSQANTLVMKPSIIVKSKTKGGRVSRLDKGVASVMNNQNQFAGITTTQMVSPAQGSSSLVGLGSGLKSLSKSKTSLLYQPAFADSFFGGSFESFGFGGGFLPPTFPSLGGYGEPRRKKRRAKARSVIRPSFTGIITGFSGAGKTTKILGGMDIGVTPGTIRGLETGFNLPKKKTKKKKKK